MARSTEQLEQSGRLLSRDPGGHVCPAIKSGFRGGTDGIVNQPCLLGSPRGSNVCHAMWPGALCLCQVLLRGDRASTVGGRLVPPPRTQLPGLMQTSKTRFAAAGRGGGSGLELPVAIRVGTLALHCSFGFVFLSKRRLVVSWRRHYSADFNRASVALLQLPAVGRCAQCRCAA